MPRPARRKWEDELGGGESWSSMTYADGRIYSINTAGTTFVMEPTPEGVQNRRREQARRNDARLGGFLGWAGIHSDLSKPILH